MTTELRALGEMLRALQLVWLQVRAVAVHRLFAQSDLTRTVQAACSRRMTTAGLPLAALDSFRLKRQRVALADRPALALVVLATTTLVPQAVTRLLQAPNRGDQAALPAQLR